MPILQKSGAGLDEEQETETEVKEPRGTACATKSTNQNRMPFTRIMNHDNKELDILTF